MNGQMEVGHSLLSNEHEFKIHWVNNGLILLDFKHLKRFIQVLSALGDTAFRELTIYFESIPYDDLPEWILPYLNVCSFH